MERVILVVIGIVIGIILSFIFSKLFSEKATLQIDHSNPEKDLYRLNIYDFDALNRKKYIRVKIDHNADLSQQ